MAVKFGDENGILKLKALEHPLLAVLVSTHFCAWLYLLHALNIVCSWMMLDVPMMHLCEASMHPPNSYSSSRVNDLCLLNWGGNPPHFTSLYQKAGKKKRPISIELNVIPRFCWTLN